MFESQIKICSETKGTKVQILEVLFYSKINSISIENFLELNFKARVGFEPTITGLQPVALATWPPRHILKQIKLLL